MSNPSSAFKSQGTVIKGVLEKTVTAAFVAATDKITRASGSWITDGFLVGMTVTTNDGDSGNAAGGVITALTSTDMTLAGTLADVAAAAKIITGKATVGEIKSFNGPGGQSSDIDITTLESTAKEFLQGLQDEGEFSFSANLHPSDVGQTFCRNARSAQLTRGFEVILADTDTTTFTFDGNVKGFSVAGAVDDVVKADVTIKISGPVTWA